MHRIMQMIMRLFTSPSNDVDETLQPVCDSTPKPQCPSLKVKMTWQKFSKLQTYSTHTEDRTATVKYQISIFNYH